MSELVVTANAQVNDVLSQHKYEPTARREVAVDEQVQTVLDQSTN